MTSETCRLEAAERALVLLSSAQRLHKRSFRPGVNWPALIPMTTDAGSRGDGEIWGDALFKDIEGRLNVGFIVNANNDDGSPANDAFTAYRCAEVSRQEYRGRVVGVADRVVQINIAILDGAIHRRTYFPSLYVGWTSGKWNLMRLTDAGVDPPAAWRKATAEGPWASPTVEQGNFASAVSIALGLQFDLHFQWRVELGVEEDFALSFETDPQGVCELFRMREAPPGKTRREALIHWVRNHYRKRRDGGLTEVKRHLRGASDFTWGDMRCRIHPARADLAALR